PRRELVRLNGDVFGIQSLGIPAEQIHGKRDNLVVAQSLLNFCRCVLHFSHLIFFNSLSITLNSGSPVTNSAFLVLANAAAKQSAYDIFLVALKTAAWRTSSKSRASTGTSSIRIPAISWDLESAISCDAPRMIE